MFNSNSTIMKATITIYQLWGNPSIMGFFMSAQAIKTLTEIVNEFGYDAALSAIDNTYDDVDELSEDLHHADKYELLRVLGLEEEYYDDAEEPLTED